MHKISLHSNPIFSPVPRDKIVSSTEALIIYLHYLLSHLNFKKGVSTHFKVLHFQNINSKILQTLVVS